MAPNTTFKSLNFNPFIVDDSPNNYSQDPNVNSFHDSISPLDTNILPSDFNGNFEDSRKLHFLFFILNIRSLNENFKSFVESLSFKFSIICILETWSNDQKLTQKLSKNSLFHVTGDSLLHENRKYRKRWRSSFFWT